MKITLSRLSNSILGTLASRVIGTSTQKVYESIVKDHPLLSTLQTEHTAYVAVFGKTTYSGMGSTVLEADVARDSAYSGLKTIVLGFSKLNGYQFQSAASDLYSLFENRGLNLINYSYADETTEMSKLISDLEKPQNTAILTQLNLISQFEMLKAAQKAFEEIYIQQASANAELRQMESATSIRRNLEDALRNYLGVVQGMKNISGWSELYTELSEQVKAIRNSKMDVRTVETAPTTK